MELGADDHALEFPVLYASGKDGWATADLDAARGGAVANVHELFDAIVEHVPVPDLDADAPLQALITTLDYSDYVGRIGIGRVFAGSLAAGVDVARKALESGKARDLLDELRKASNDLAEEAA